MNACEAEILTVTKYQPRKKYKNHQDYLLCLLKQIDALPIEKLEHCLSHQVYKWYEDAANAFKGYKPLPELPEIKLEELRYPRDDEGYVPPDEMEQTPEQMNGAIASLLEAQVKAETALDELAEVTEKVRAKRISKYRQPDISEGARYYMHPELDSFGLVIGSKRHQAALLLERGATMKQISEEVGYPVYNLVRHLREKGHKISNKGGIIKLTHKDGQNEPGN